jgi:hypothetical protein
MVLDDGTVAGSQALVQPTYYNGNGPSIWFGKSGKFRFVKIDSKSESTVAGPFS